MTEQASSRDSGIYISRARVGKNILVLLLFMNQREHEVELVCALREIHWEIVMILSMSWMVGQFDSSFARHYQTTTFSGRKRIVI
jgi:hypothetical protein